MEPNVHPAFDYDAIPDGELSYAVGKSFEHILIASFVGNFKF